MNGIKHALQVAPERRFFMWRGGVGKYPIQTTDKIIEKLYDIN